MVRLWLGFDYNLFRLWLGFDYNLVRLWLGYVWVMFSYSQEVYRYVTGL